MIDLREMGLPDAIEVDGKPFLLNTNFRDWLKFGEIIGTDEFKQWIDSDFLEDTGISFRDFFFLFDGEIPRSNFMHQLMMFYVNPNETPKSKVSGSKTPNTEIFNYICDGEYIVGSFMQAYHIDLTSISYMHWHMFKALFTCLPENTRMREIMSIRSWDEGDEKKDYKIQKRKLREAWELPKKISGRNDEILEEINKEFYNAV